MKIRRILSLAIVLLMAFSLIAACGDNNGGGVTPPPAGTSAAPDGGEEATRYANTRTIQVGIWWDPTQIYDSNRKEFTDSEANPLTAQMRLDNMRAIEDRYNVRLEFVDMTFSGAQESISTSIMAGSPDVDVYCMDLNFGIPYVLAKYCMAIDEYAKPGSDIFTAETVFTPVNVCNLPKDYLLRTSPPMDLNGIYQLGYNWDLLQEFNQPSPQDLWDDDKWTWDAWLDIMKAVTDTNRNTYGWGGDHVRLLDNLLISNGTGIALSDKEGMTAPATIEVFDFIYKLYNEHNAAIPWNDGIEYWDNSDWSTGTRGFFTWIAWLAQRNGVSRGFGTENDAECAYTIRVVNWPVGPSGSKATNRGANLSGNVFMIPTGTKDASVVYDVFFDYHNWFDYDLDDRNEAAFWVESYYADDLWGFEMVQDLGTRPQLDLWDNLNITNGDGDRFGIGTLLNGSATAAQLAESWRLVTQDYIDTAYGKK